MNVPETELFSALPDVAVENDWQNDHQDDGHRGATGDAGPLQQDLLP